MKPDDVSEKKGLLGSIWKTMTGAGSCCAPGSNCCGTKSETSDNEAEHKSDMKNTLKIYDPPMCCSSGVCGTNVDNALVEFAGALKVLAKHGIAVERWNLAQQPQAFAENSQVKELLVKHGKGELPFIFVNDELKISGRYPKVKELFTLLGIAGETESSDACCTDGCCR